MCGIFGIIGSNFKIRDLMILSKHARQRGRDSSGIVKASNDSINIYRADFDLKNLIPLINLSNANLLCGHSRLITNGFKDNQPVVRDNIILIHNGIILNDKEIWSNLSLDRELEIDSEAILGVAIDHLNNGGSLETLADKIFQVCDGIVSAALIFPKIGKILLLSNNGSLYVGYRNNNLIFASEYYPLSKIGCEDISQVLNSSQIHNISLIDYDVQLKEFRTRKNNLVPSLVKNTQEESLLIFNKPDLKRCLKCILPETMPFIYFDQKDICNYCNNYILQNQPKDISILKDLVEPYRRSGDPDCVVPFSGGRDSSYGLHLIIDQLKMKPITYTYDWAMVTDLARRNISRMCSQLNIENIIIADDIEKKRNYISKNLKAWLKSPHLGMLSILTAGDKHFFRHIESVKKQLNIDLNLWSVNPLETTHFKSGFLGIPPDFEQKSVYTKGLNKQLRYQGKRFYAMMDSPAYFNSSLWDTLSGEYFRSFHKKKDYFHVFDYWKWDERIIDSTLKEYDWEVAEDTTSTWRIGDGTAAFYNYVYYTVAGFTEHDTFRSNQIREGDITREEALKLVGLENRPRYQNLKWYLDVLQFDFKSTINIVNKMPKLYE